MDIGASVVFCGGKMNDTAAVLDERGTKMKLIGQLCIWSYNSSNNNNLIAVIKVCNEIKKEII